MCAILYVHNPAGFAQGRGKIATFLLVPTSGGVQNSNCVSTKGAFRLIQSIHSPKAESFKLWLAQVGCERVQEIEKRVRGIVVRQELTNEWKNRGASENRDFAILTNEMSKATFGKTVEEYKQFKGLQKENLRDHMNDLELIFTMLGEKVTTEITTIEDAQGFSELNVASKRGGGVAGSARKHAEQEIGRPVTSQENYLDDPERERRKRIEKK